MRKLDGAVVALDFDGTCVVHQYPDIGPPVDNCIKVLKKIIEAGAKICLDTMRKGEHLKEAVGYLKENGIELWGINNNPEHPDFLSKTKVYRDMYIGDDAIGCPMTYDYKHTEYGQFVDWFKIEDILFPVKTNKVISCQK